MIYRIDITAKYGNCRFHDRREVDERSAHSAMNRAESWFKMKNPLASIVAVHCEPQGRGYDLTGQNVCAVAEAVIEDHGSETLPSH